MGNKVYKKVLIGVIIATLVIFISTICIVNHKEDQTLKILSKKGSTLKEEELGDRITVTLDYNDGTGKTETFTMPSGGTYAYYNNVLAYNSTTPTRDGYSFIGWYYGDKEVSCWDKAVVAEDHILIAKWQADYIVTLFYNYRVNGEVPTEKISVKASDPRYLNLPIPEREGYVFCGWWYGDYQALSGGELFVKADHEIYAKWKTVDEYYSCTVTLDYGYDAKKEVFSASWRETRYADENAYGKELPNPVRTGYKFLGWYYGITKIDSYSYVISNDHTLTAKWEEVKQYTIQYNSNNGENAPENQTKNEGENIKISSVVPTKAGYKFKEWNTNQDGTGTAYQPGEDYSKDENVTLYAQWEKENVSVESVSLDKTEATLKEGKNLHLIATINPDTATNSEVRWDSSNTDVATVKDGLVVAKSKGTAIITVTTVDGGKTATCNITVESTNINVENISLDKKQATIKIGGNIQLTATVTPDNATNKNVSWESSNTAVATVDDNGYVMAKSVGTATITAKTEDGGKTATATITVEKEITDEQGPTIVSIKGEKDSEGNYKVIIKATDESGIQKVLVNGAEITTKDSRGNFYFIPTKNGTYKIEVYDKVGNKKEQEYTEEHIIEKVEATANKDSDGNNIVYIATITNKKVTSVKVNGAEIKDIDSEGRYYFKPTQNGTYKVAVEYEDGTTEESEYTEERITNNNNGDNNSSNSNNNGNNGGNNTTNNVNNGNSSTNNSSNGNSNSGTNTSNSNTALTSGNTIGTSTALTNLPKTGTTMGVLFATIASGITAGYAWFKHKNEI